MALGACAWECRPVNGNDNWGGGFQVDSAITWPADGSFTSANTSSPVFSSASYNFAAGDQNDYIWLPPNAQAAGIQPGMYLINSVASNNATLTAPSTGVVDSTHQSTSTVSNVAWAIDRSQRNSAYAVCSTGQVNTGTPTNVTVNGATVTFSTGTFAVCPGDVGNIVDMIVLSGGTLGRYAITNCTPGLNGSWTLDATTGAVSITNANFNMGGAAQSLPSVIGSATTRGIKGNRYFVKCEGSAPQYSIAAGIACSALTSTPAATSPYNRITGYFNTRGDIYQSSPGVWNNLSNRPTFQGTAGTFTCFSPSTNGWLFENLIVDCNNQTASLGISGSVLGCIYNCLIKNFTTAGTRNFAANAQFLHNEFTGGVSGATAAIVVTTTGAQIIGNYIHDNACPGISATGAAAGNVIFHNLIANNTGATSDGIITAYGTFICQNTIFGSGRHNINQNQSPNMYGMYIRNNIFANAGAWGVLLSNSNSGAPAFPWWDGNAYYNNSSGKREFMDDGSYGSTPTAVTTAINAVCPYTDVLDVYLTNNPFVSSGTGDFRINPASPGGTLLIGTALPGLHNGYSQRSYFDFGAIQHQDALTGLVLTRTVPMWPDNKDFSSASYQKMPQSAQIAGGPVFLTQHIPMWQDNG